MSQDLKNNRSSNSSNEQPTPKKFSLENLANLSKILAKGAAQNSEKIAR